MNTPKNLSVLNMSLSFTKQSRSYLLLPLLLYSFTGTTQVSISGSYKNPMFTISFNNTSVIRTQPSNLLYNFHDGGLDQDACRPQADFDVATDQMLKYVADNMNSRIDALQTQASVVRAAIAAGMPAILEHNTKQLQQMNSLKQQLQVTANQPPIVLDKVRQDQQEAYVKNLQQYKGASEKELQGAMSKRKLSQEAVTDLNRIKTDLLDETRWHSGDWALVSSFVASNINAHSNLIYDLLAVNPALSGNPVITTVSELKALFEESLIKGELDPGAIRNGYLKAHAIDALTAGNDLLGITNAFVSYGQSVAQMTSVPEDQEALRQEIKQQLLSIDKAIETYNQRIESTRAVIEYHKFIQEAIRSYFKTNGIDDQGMPAPVLQDLPPMQQITPEGFNGLNLGLQEQVFGKETSYTARSIASEKAKTEDDFTRALERVKEFTLHGQADPVFSSLSSYEETKRQADMCIQYAGDIHRDLEKIKKDYPGVDEKLVMEWLLAAKQVRYMADQYLPYSDKQFRFTTVDMDLLRTEITQAVIYLKQQEPIPDYACNIYTATLLHKLYGVDPSLFQHKNGSWLSANEIAARASIEGKFNAIGPALDQGNLDKASYLATIGKPVIAVYYSETGHGHISLLLPGLNAGAASRSGSWDMWVPLITNYSLTTSGECTGCFTEGKMSDAFSKEKAKTTILYWIH
jgi:hypothetical protein